MPVEASFVALLAEAATLCRPPDFTLPPPLPMDDAVGLALAL
jgi:hypothetical protein